ncbi:MAG: glycosyltransferase family 2 protein [Candidatus Wildermuthbacteria bacterium]|nr:glycosyltransferase family 2 protein [Candidatus Wildermuthbacteria bacterium]
MNNNYNLSVVIPALNEEKNILLAIDNTLSAFKEFGIAGEIIVVNDGSTDSTSTLVKNKIIGEASVLKMVTHDKRKGIGASFWDGVDNATGEAVVMIPGDNENDPREILRYYKLLEHVDIVVPFIFNKEARSFFRKVISSAYRFVINATFSVNFNYTNGTILYRRSILKELDCRSSGFFFQADILIRTAKNGYLFAEVPYMLGKRKEGKSKAITFSSLAQVVKEYLRLVSNYYFGKNSSTNSRQAKDKARFSPDSLTAVRRDNKFL